MNYLQLRLGAYLAARKIPAEVHQEENMLVLCSEAGTLGVQSHIPTSRTSWFSNVPTLDLSFTYSEFFPELLQKGVWRTQGYFPALFHTQPILGLQKDLLQAHRYFVKEGGKIAQGIEQYGMPDCTDSLDAMVDWARDVLHTR